MCVLQSRACVYFYRAIYVRCARGRAAGEAEGGRNRSENAAAAPASVEVLETFTFGFSWFETGPGETDTLRTHCHKTRTILKIVKPYVPCYKRIINISQTYFCNS